VSTFKILVQNLQIGDMKEQMVIRILIFVIAIFLFLLVSSKFFPVIKDTGENLYNMSNVSQLIGTDILGWGGKIEEKVEIRCPAGMDSSDEKIFLVRSGYLGKDKTTMHGHETKYNDIDTKWSCNVPGVSSNDGLCLIKNLNRYDYTNIVAMSSGVWGREEFNINDNSGIIFENTENHVEHKHYYIDGSNKALFFISNMDIGENIENNEVFNLWSRFGEWSSGWGEDYSEVEINKYNLSINYQYCCPNGWKWDGEVCCPEGVADCSDKTTYPRFNEYCANELGLIEKVNCGVTSSHQGDCVNDEDIQNSCSEPTDWGHEGTNGYNNGKSLCIDRSNRGTCVRDGKDVSQCVRLNFSEHYGHSMYIKDLWFRVQTDHQDCKTSWINYGCHNDFAIFACEDGKTCNDMGGNWKTIENEINAWDVTHHTFIGEKISAIDLCVLRTDEGDHRLAWVKFTTNEL